MKKLPLTKKTPPESGAHASPVWEGLLSPLDSRGSLYNAAASVKDPLESVEISWV